MFTPCARLRTADAVLFEASLRVLLNLYPITSWLERRSRPFGAQEGLDGPLALAMDPFPAEKFTGLAYLWLGLPVEVLDEPTAGRGLSAGGALIIAERVKQRLVLVSTILR